MLLIDDSWAFAFALVGAIGSVATAVAVIFLWIQSRQTQIQIQLTQEQTQLTREEMESTLRPWIYPKWKSHESGGGTFGTVTTSPKDGKQIIQLEFVNSGKQATELSKVFFEYGVSDVEDSAKIEEIVRRKIPIERNTVLVPDYQFQISPS